LPRRLPLRPSWWKTVAAEDQTRQPVVVLLHDVPPFTPLTAADVTVEKLRNAPAGSLASVDQAVGRTPWRHLSAGTWLNDESFEAGGSLARMIHSDERALTVAVDEVIGAAGQLLPATMSMCCSTCARMRAICSSRRKSSCRPCVCLAWVNNTA
jgi:Flp pilus assembly protein CpaB